MVDYFSFDDVINELNVSEEDLKRMVSEGEIRAFRSDNKMKFRKEDVENLRKGKTTEPTIILPPSDLADAGTDVGLDLDIDSEALTVEAPPAKPKSETKAPIRPKSETKPAARPKSERVSAIPPTRPKSETQPALDLDLAPEPEPELAAEDAEQGSSVADINLDDLKVADETASAEPEETFIEEGSEEDSGAVTAPLALADESGEEAAETEADTGEITDEGLEADADTTAPRARGGRRARTGTMAPVAAAAPKVGVFWVILLFLGFIPSLAAAIFSADYLAVEAGVREYPSGMTGSSYDTSLERSWKNGEWTSKVQVFQSPAPPWTVSIPANDSKAQATTMTFGTKHTGPTYKTPDLGGPAAPPPAGP